MRLVRWHTDDLLRRLDDVIAVYGAAMGYPGGLLETRRGYVAAHAQRSGFRATARSRSWAARCRSAPEAPDPAGSPCPAAAGRRAPVRPGGPPRPGRPDRARLPPWP